MKSIVALAASLVLLIGCEASQSPQYVRPTPRTEPETRFIDENGREVARTLGGQVGGEVGFWEPEKTELYVNGKSIGKFLRQDRLDVIYLTRDGKEAREHLINIDDTGFKE